MPGRHISTPQELRARRRQAAEAAVIFVCCAVAVALLAFAGASHRRYLQTPRVLRITEQNDSFSVWSEHNVQGRVLFLFDSPLNIYREATKQENQYLFLAIEKGIVRKIYHVIPDALWHDVSSSLQKQKDVVRSGEGFRMAVYEGVSVYIMRMQDIPRINEPALVSINGDLWSDIELARIFQRLTLGIPESDLVTLSGRITKRDPKEVQDAFNQGT